MTPIIDHLTRFVAEMLSTMPPPMAQGYLRRVVAVTSEAYGEKVSKELQAVIDRKMAE